MSFQPVLKFFREGQLTKVVLAFSYKWYEASAIEMKVIFVSSFAI